MSTLTLQVADRFPAGTKVGAYPRVADFFTPGQTGPTAEAKVAKDGTLKLSGLVEHGPYFLAAEIEEDRPDAFAPNGRRTVKTWCSIAVIASDPTPALDRDATNAQAQREAEAAAKVVSKTSVDLASAPAGDPSGPRAMPAIVEGARDTSHILPERIEGTAKNTPLASHTATGEAVVVGEEPRKQEDISARTKQSSDTETGSAAVVEDVPRQEDVGSRTKQASDTETGVATTTDAHVPKPDAGDTAARKTAARKDASAKTPVKTSGRKRSGAKKGRKTGTKKARKR